MEELGIIALVISVIATLVKYGFEWFDDGPALPSGGPGHDPTPPSGPAIPPGFDYVRKKTEWTLTSGPRVPCRIRAEARWGGSVPDVGFIRVEVEGVELSPAVARLFAGEARGWHWGSGAWECRLGRRTELVLGEVPSEHGLLDEALTRIGEAQALHRRTRRALTFGPEALVALETPGTANPATLAGLGQTLAVEIGADDPELAIHLAKHLDSPVVWLVLLENRRAASAAYVSLFARGPQDPFENEAIERALRAPETLDAGSLAALFGALERRGDTRLAPLLTRLLMVANRGLMVSWLERHGDVSAFGPLEELLEHSGPGSREGIEKALTAIKFRREAALSHTIGGLSIQDEGGTLALTAVESPAEQESSS